MVFNFSVNAQKSDDWRGFIPTIGESLIKIGVQLQFIIFLIGDCRELIQRGIGQFQKFDFIRIQFLSHFGQGIYQSRSVSRIIDTHKVHFIVVKVHIKSLFALLCCVVCSLSDITTDMVLAGDSVLAEATMLNPGRVMTYAVYVKSFAKEKLVNELIDPAEQIRVELWEYDPKQFSEDDMADRLSVALSFEGNEDERVEEAVEELLEGIWTE